MYIRRNYVHLINYANELKVNMHGKREADPYPIEI